MNANHSRGLGRESVSLLSIAAVDLAISAAVAAILTVSAGAPSPDATSPERLVLNGPAQPLGEGTVRTYVETVDGRPTEVGVAMSERALEGLPANHRAHGGVAMPDGHMMFEYVLELPAGNPTPYRHVSLNWNPGGHEPPGIYDTPHFDFHFQLIGDAERRTITPDQPGWATGELHPAPSLMPAGVVPLPPAVPLMGLHWIDPQAPELNGEPFTQTFIFGTWQGRLIFAEPMITAAYLRSRPDFTAPLPLPADLEASRHLPSRYSIRWDQASREYRVSLSGFPGN